MVDVMEEKAPSGEVNAGLHFSGVSAASEEGVAKSANVRQLIALPAFFFHSTCSGRGGTISAYGYRQYQAP